MMDDELRKAFATLSAQMSDIGTDARHAADQARLAVNATNLLTSRISGLEADVGQLKTAVYGSNPPPAPIPVVKRITQGEGDIAELAGQVIAVKADIAAVKEINEEQSQKLSELSETVGLTHKAVTGFFENPKVRFVGKTLFGLAMAYAAAKGIRVLP